MNPIDYSSAFGDSQGPLQAFNQALAGGLGIRQNVMQQEQKQLAFDRQKQFQTDVAQLGANPTPQGIARLSVIYPEHAEQFKKSFDMLAPEQQKAKISAVIPVYAAIQSGRPDVAVAKLRETADAMDGSGQKDEAARTRAMAELIEQHPETGSTTTGLLLASAMGPDKFAETFGKLGSESRAIAEAPADLAQKKALATKTGEEAKSAATVAKFAESKAISDLKLTDAHVKALAEDTEIKRQNMRIAAMNAALAGKKDAREERELQSKLADATAKRDLTVRERVADANSAAASMDNFLNTADRILAASVDKDGKPTSTLRAAAGPVDSRIPTVQQDVADLEALVETMGSQAFLSQIPSMKGLGALSNAEGEKLQSSLTNLSLKQSPSQLIANIKEAQRLILKGRSTLAKRTGVDLGIPDTPAAEPSAGDIEALVKKYTAPGRGQ